MKHTVYLGLGSNVGHRIEFLALAIRGLADLDRSVVDGVSNVYETEPVGNVPQQNFLNLAVSVRTDLDHTEFHRLMKLLEKEIGRTESVLWGPREIDIDLLMFDSIVIDSDTVRIPHRELAKRKFVLQPLSDIAPMALHPLLHKTIEELNNETTDNHGVVHSESNTSQLFALINDSITNPTV